MPGGTYGPPGTQPDNITNYSMSHSYEFHACPNHGFTL